MKQIIKSINLNIDQNKNAILLNLCFFVLFVAIDQASKVFMLTFLMNVKNGSMEVLPFFNLTFILNRGVSFGFLSQVSHAKIIILTSVCIIVLFLTILFLKESNFVKSFAYTLILSGAIGNTIDRIKYGGVIDFLDFYIKNWHYPAFNFADAFVFCGAVILIFYDLFKKRYEV